MSSFMKKVLGAYSVSRQMFDVEDGCRVIRGDMLYIGTYMWLLAGATVSVNENIATVTTASIEEGPIDSFDVRLSSAEAAEGFARELREVANRDESGWEAVRAAQRKLVKSGQTPADDNNKIRVQADRNENIQDKFDSSQMPVMPLEAKIGFMQNKPLSPLMGYDMSPYSSEASTTASAHVGSPCASPRAPIVPSPISLRHVSPSPRRVQFPCLNSYEKNDQRGESISKLPSARKEQEPQQFFMFTPRCISSSELLDDGTEDGSMTDDSDSDSEPDDLANWLDAEIDDEINDRLGGMHLQGSATSSPPLKTASPKALSIPDFGKAMFAPDLDKQHVKTFTPTKARPSGELFRHSIFNEQALRLTPRVDDLLPPNHRVARLGEVPVAATEELLD